jgi:starch phosphorylase
LARNLWWSWNPDAIALFRRLDEDLYSATGHNPVKLIGSIDQSRLDELAEDAGFLAHMDRVALAFDTHMKAKTWFQDHYPDSKVTIAYFSAEFGIHESLPIYSGGLGILAGDHLKSAGELGILSAGILSAVPQRRRLAARTLP